MTVSVFVGTSVDGFIARPNGEFDFLPAGGGEPHGYEEFMASVDALVIGRNTFEAVLKLDPWPYGKKRVVVLSSRPVDLSAVLGGAVEQMAGTPAEIVSKLAASGARNLYVDGGSLCNDSYVQGWCNASLLRELPCLSVKEFLSLALWSAMCDCITLRRGNMRAAWFRASIRSSPNPQSGTHCFRTLPLLIDRSGGRLPVSN